MELFALAMDIAVFEEGASSSVMDSCIVGMKVATVWAMDIAASAAGAVVVSEKDRQVADTAELSVSGTDIAVFAVVERFVAVV